MNRNSDIRVRSAAVLAIAAGAMLGAMPATAWADPIERDLTVLEDFDVTTLSRSLFGGTSRSFLTNQARYQVNGNSSSTFGIYSVFDFDGEALRPSDGVESIESLTFNITAAVNRNTGGGGVQSEGDLQIFFTTDNGDLNEKEFNTADATGLVGQFSDLTLISDAFQEEGIYDIERVVDLSSVEADIVEAINNGDNLRFIIASPTPDAVFQFATGLPDPSPLFDFFGEATTVVWLLNPTSGTCIADWNGDGEVDINDFFAYLSDFEDGDPRADLNNDGEIDINDFFIFLSEFEAGC